MTHLYIFDLDGTLADINHRVHFLQQTPKDWESFFKACPQDTPIEPVIKTMNALLTSGSEVRIWSGRGEEERDSTIAWLKKHTEFNPTHKNLLMRPKGYHVVDTTLKKGWLNDLPAADRSRLVCTFDDRTRVVHMWRSQGIQCNQVAPGDY
jgi:hypothetical protein